MSAIHVLISLSFGIGLIVSGLTDREGKSFGYSVLREIPGWPFSLGGGFLALAILLTYSRIGNHKYGLSAVAFLGMGVLTITYGASLLSPSLNAQSLGSVIGPQAAYFGVGCLQMLHATTSWYVWLKGSHACQRSHPQQPGP